MDFYAYKDDKTNKVESQKFFLISEQRKEIVKQRGDGKVAILRLQETHEFNSRWKKFR